MLRIIALTSFSFSAKQTQLLLYLELKVTGQRLSVSPGWKVRLHCAGFSRQPKTYTTFAPRQSQCE